MAISFNSNLSLYPQNSVAFKGNNVIELATEEAVKGLDKAFRRQEIQDLYIKACHDITRKEILKMPLYWCMQKYGQASNFVTGIINKIKL